MITRYQGYFTNFKTVPLDTNVGLGLALREGLEHCSYELVARMDSDDIAKPNRFEEQLNYFQEHPEIDILGSAVTEINSGIDEVISEKKIPLSHESISTYMKRRNPFCHYHYSLSNSCLY